MVGTSDVAQNAPIDIVTYARNGELLSLPMAIGSGVEPEKRRATIHFRNVGDRRVGVMGQPPENLRNVLEKHAEGATKSIVDVGLRPVLCYSRAEEDMEVFKPGDYGFVLGCIRNLGVVDEEALTWEQVGEFRKDGASRAELVRFHHWLVTAMAMKSKAEVQDHLCHLYEKRQAGFRKFGIATRITGDSVAAVTEQRWEKLAVAAGGMVGGLALDTVVGALVAGVALTSGVVVQLRKTRAELRAEDNATAFIYGLVERFGSPVPIESTIAPGTGAPQGLGRVETDDARPAAID